jgi:hypothetical protein
MHWGRFISNTGSHSLGENTWSRFGALRSDGQHEMRWRHDLMSCVMGGGEATSHCLCIEHCNIDASLREATRNKEAPLNFKHFVFMDL